MKRFSVVLLSLTTLVMSVVFSYPVSADAGVMSQLVMGDDTSVACYGVNYLAQTFITTSTANPKEVWVKLSAVGTPTASYACAIRATASGLPTGANICSGNITGSQVSTMPGWYRFTMSGSTSDNLTISTAYAVILYSDNATIANHLNWRIATVGSYTGGVKSASVNSGTAWTAALSSDLLFQVRSDNALQIQDAKVFQSYKTTGDWLVVARYQNNFPQYVNTTDIKKYFAIQLTDNSSTPLASNPITEWGNRVGSIYLAPSVVVGLDWNGPYNVTIKGLTSENQSVTYNLVAADWLGDDLTNLDSWMFLSANAIGVTDGVAMTTNVATRGTCLNSRGGDICTAGCPGLQTVRPAIFQIYTAPTAYVPQTATATFANTSRAGTAAAIGPDAVTAFGRLGSDALGGIPFNYVIAIVAVVLCFGLAGATFPFGHTTAANVLCLGILFAFGYFGFDWIWIGMVYAVSVFLLAKKLWIDTGI